MSRNESLAIRLREVLLNGRLIANTNFKEQITTVTWEQATQKVADLNTIAMLTYHVNYYLQGLINVLEGGLLEIRDKYSFDIPPIESGKDWSKLVNEFLINSEKFANQVEKLPEEKLDEIFVDKKYGSYSRNIEGVIEHSYYHLGQVSLIKKMISME